VGANSAGPELRGRDCAFLTAGLQTTPGVMRKATYGIHLATLSLLLYSVTFFYT
jgi:hypothetical protein